METVTPNYVIVSQTKKRTEQMGHGRLVIHDKYVDGVLVASAFTLDSLCHVLDMPKSTMEGRYARGRLCHWKLDLPNGFGRPARGFPLAMLEEVIYIVRTRGAKVTADETGDKITFGSGERESGPLIPFYYLGKAHFTIGALADHYGYSETTIRKKLSKAGLMGRQVDLGASLHGGRPRRGFPESVLADINLAIKDNVVFTSELDRILIRATGAREESRKTMEASITRHEPASHNPLRAYNHETMRPASPVNGGNSTGEADPLRIDETVAEIERLMAAHAKSTPSPVEASAGDGYVPGEPHFTAHTQFETMPSEQEALKAERDQEAANRAAMVEPMRKQLIDQADEPTGEEYADTVYALDLGKADGAAFIASVKAAREQRLTM